MTREEKIDKYKATYGEDAPIPPDHMLDYIVHDEFINIYKSVEASHPDAVEELIKDILKSIEVPLDPDNPIWRKLD